MQLLTTGQTIGPYEILDKLGEGGMGVVYKARDRRLRRNVALKFLSENAADPTTRTRFLREAQTASALSHPNIVTVYDIGEDGETGYIVMEYVEGQPMNRVIPAGGLAPGKALEYAIQLAEALAAAHSAGIVHRDLKPGNVLLDRSGRIKVLDFGLAKFDSRANSEVTQSVALTEDGSFMGTVAYVAPEQSMGRGVDPRSDLFSFGVLLQEMFTGDRPFRAPHQLALLHEINYGKPKPVREGRPDLPENLEVLVSVLLEKKPENRYQSMDEVLPLLRALRHDLDSGATEATAHGPIVRPAHARSGTERSSATTLEKTSIAVLAFRSLSADPDDKFLAEGIASEVIRALSGVPGVRVASQLASFRFKGEDTDPARIAEALHIRYVLTGSVRRAGSRIRVIAELTDAVASSVIWSHTFDRSTDDIFAVQEEIAKAIVGATGGQIIKARAEWANTEAPASLDAAGLVRRAYHFLNQAYNPDAINDSIELLRRAVQLSPEYALAHAFLGMQLTQRLITGGSTDPAKDHADAMAAAERGTQLAPGDGEVLENCGLVFLNGGKYEQALPLLRRAVEVAPLNLVAWGYLGLALGWGGEDREAEEGRQILERLIESTPDHPSMPYWLYFLAGIFARQGRFEKAAECGRRSVEQQPRFIVGLIEHANALGALGRHDEARRVIGQAMALSPNTSEEFYMIQLVNVTRTLERARPHVSGLIAAGIFKG
jgi:serine/threonine protein kinase/tetratricopeptide (TPR) repeat protein